MRATACDTEMVPSQKRVLVPQSNHSHQGSKWTGTDVHPPMGKHHHRWGIRRRRGSRRRGSSHISATACDTEMVPSQKRVLVPQSNHSHQGSNWRGRWSRSQTTATKAQTGQAPTCHPPMGKPHHRWGTRVDAAAVDTAAHTRAQRELVPQSNHSHQGSNWTGTDVPSH